MTWAAVGAAAVSVVGGLMSANASSKAAKAQQNLSREALIMQHDIDQRTYKDFDPYRQSGAFANTTLQQLLGPGGDLAKQFEFGQDPGYQFGLNQGTDALNSQMAARGLRMSPASLMALTRYNQDYAGTKYNEAFQRDLAAKAQRFGFLSDLANRGSNAAAMSGQSGQAAAGNAAGLLTGMGNAQAAGIMGSNNALVGGMNGVLNAYQGYQQQKMLNDYLNGPKGGTPAVGPAPSGQERY